MSNPPLTHEITLSIGWDVIDSSTPTLPNAKRGRVSEKHVKATEEQLKAGLIWWPCGFCGRYVLIDSWRNTREKCTCGAVRRNHHGNAIWKKGDEICEYI